MTNSILAEQPCNRQDALNHMESCYIEKKQQVELLQTEIARLNHKCERQTAEILSMQAEIDLLKAARETERAVEEEINAAVCLREGVEYEK